MSSKSLRVVTIFHVNSYNSSWSKTIKPNHNVLKVSASGDGRSERALDDLDDLDDLCDLDDLKVSASGDGRSERALSNGEGRNAQVELLRQNFLSTF